MIPISSINKGSVHKHLLEMLEILGVVVLHESVVMVEWDACVLRVPADVDDLAAFLEDFRRQHGEGEMTFDDSSGGQTEKKI